jgi:hypothetical protein
MGIVARGEQRKPVYVMRRARGRKLSTVIIDAGARVVSDALPAARRALEFLAYYHAFGWRGSSTRRSVARQNWDGPIRKVATHWRAAGGGTRECQGLLDVFGAMLPRTCPSLLKKDAHAENWLVTARAELVMIDLEATSALPLLYEAAQLIEDYPLLPCDAAGERVREDLVATYSAVLESLAPAAVQGLLSDSFTLYQSASLHRVAVCVVGLEKRSTTGLQSESALRAAPRRMAHYRDLVSQLARSGRSKAIRECAALLSAFLTATGVTE